MTYEIQQWTIKDLLELYTNKSLSLNPPYQRNAIWNKKAQRQLIESIKAGFPIPTFFILQNNDGKYEMVDGQQRTRALLAFKHTPELDDSSDEDFKKSRFDNYLISVTLINDLLPGEYIEEFYDLVNSQGLRLNRPETIKAKYFSTRFLELVEKITKMKEFQLLEIVPVNSQKRMQDRDLVEELVALSIHGISDKKNLVDKIYEVDIDKNQVKATYDKFVAILKILNDFNTIRPLKDTRFRQRNDIYTLVAILSNRLSEKKPVLSNFYKALLAIEPGIKPSRGGCLPLASYAFACISQSNSSAARFERSRILNELIFNDTNAISESQQELINYYELTETALYKISTFLSIKDTKIAAVILNKEKNKENS